MRLDELDWENVLRLLAALETWNGICGGLN